MGAVISYLTSLNWQNPTWDVFILLFFVVGALLYGLSLGRDRVIVILVGIYMALAVVTNAPALTNLNLALNLNENYVLRISLFLGVFVVVFFLLSRSALLKTIGRSNAPGSWWQTIIFSILQVGLLISVTLNFLPKEMTQGLTEVTRNIFMSDQGRSAWLILPIVFMILAPTDRSSRLDGGA
ncbi:MAG: hypothetical protein ABIO72_01870 [Patescibacteria group bacterium]